jgi:Carboxypeptidase regulatory-like domain
MAATVAGKVTDLTGTGLEGIEVHASPVEDSQGTEGHDTTNDKGNYQITNLVAGKYELHVSTPGKFEPPHYMINLTQRDNLMGRNFKRTETG